MVLKLMQWNINGYHNNYNELLLIINNKLPHIIALQETHLIPSLNSPTAPKNFKMYQNNDVSLQQTAKRGVALLVSKSVQHNLVNINSDILNVALEIYAETPFVVINVYISPNEGLNPNSLQRLIDNINKPIVLIGDFNAWSPLWGSSKYNKKGKVISDFIQTNNLILLNGNNPTHFSTHSSLTSVDVSICSPALFISSSWNIDSFLRGSDHFPIFIEFFIKHHNYPNKIPIKFKTEQANWAKFRELLESKTINYIYNPSFNTNKNFAIFKKLIISCANESIPKTSTKLIKKRICWWNSFLEELQIEKQEKWKELKRSPNTENLLIYKRSNAKFKREVKNAKRVSFVNFSKEINPKTPSNILWKKVRALSSTNKSSTILHLKQNDGSITSNSQEIVNALARSWSEASFDTNFSITFRNAKVQSISVNIESQIVKARAKEIEKEITTFELDASLAIVKGKTPGQDRVTYSMLQNLPPSGKNILCNLFNQILKGGQIPHQWRIATVVPLPKENKDKLLPSSYRPISLLSCFSKLLEKIIARRMMWFLNEENLLTTKQTAFKTGKGTTEALLSIDQEICDTFSTSNHLSLISIDAEKAYDRVGIHSIINKLIEWKFGPRIITYVKNFLMYRKILVKANHTLSGIWPLENGIPQGSPISVVLFLIAYNDLSKIIDNQKYFSHIIYADDLYIFRKIKNCNEFKTKFEDLLELIINWGNYSGAKISIEKCKHIHFCKKTNCSNIVINSNTTVIDNVKDLKILGIIFNSKYSWNSHVNYLIKSLNNRINILKCLSNQKLECNTQSLINIFKSIIISKIDYGLVLYGNTAISNLNRVKTIYHSGMRLALGALRTTPITNMLTESGCLKLEDRVKSLTAHLIPKIVHSPGVELYNQYKKLIKRKRVPKKPSTLYRVITYADTFGIICSPHGKKRQKTPPWTLLSDSVILTIHTNRKEDTPEVHFKKLFLEVCNMYPTWSKVFTDGSKGNGCTAFAVVDENYDTLINGSLPEYASVFTAEAEAILCAVKLIIKSKKNTLVCTDSLSTLQAVLNVNNKDLTISEIRDIITANTKFIKLVWIPSHIGIPGNTAADEAAKLATISPLLISNCYNKRDIKRSVSYNIYRESSIDWTNYSHIYKLFNPYGQQTTYPTEAIRKKTIVYTRFKFGHTRYTKKHIFEKKPTPICSFCNAGTLSVEHIVYQCRRIDQIRILNNIPPLNELLAKTNFENINLFCDLLYKCNIFYEI